MANKVLITSALPYANGPLHFGHIAGAYLPADCYARFERLLGKDVLYLCGSDEYGFAITISAEQMGRTPQEHVDIYHEINKEFFKKLDFSFDCFSRTTNPYHAETTQQFFLDLMQNGYIEEKETNQLFSPSENKFLADRYVKGTCPKCGYISARGDECGQCGASFEAMDLLNPVSKLTGASLVLKPTKHWFLRLDLFKEKLSSWLAQKEWKNNVLKFIQNYVDDLKPRAITRDGIWGIPIPLDGTQGKVLYVWFDAPIGYISIAKEWAVSQGDPDLWKKYWCDPTTSLVQFVGKDNIPFHAAFFPAMTLGQNQPYKLVDELPANEFYLLEGRQFSKSEGWFIDLDSFFQNFTSDQIRYTIAANAPETHDSEFTWKDFEQRCNGDLLSKYGNFINRTLIFAKNKFSSKVPPLHTLQPIDQNFLDKTKALTSAIHTAYASFQLRKASQLIMELAAEGNTYFDAKKPWHSIKDPSTQTDTETTLHLCLVTVQLLALVSFPIIPQTAAKIWSFLNLSPSLDLERWDNVLAHPLPAGHTLGEPAHLFQKIDKSLIDAEMEKLTQLALEKK